MTSDEFQVSLYYTHLDTEGDDKVIQYCPASALAMLPLPGETILINNIALNMDNEVLVVLSRQWIINIDNGPSTVLIFLGKPDDLEASDVDNSNR